MANIRGLTLIELLVVVNILAVIAGVVYVSYGEFGDEARCTEIYGVFSQIIRSQGLYAIEHNRYYTGLNHDQLRAHGVDLSETQYFRYSTFPNEDSSFSIKAESTNWASGGWVLFNMKGSPQWSSDGVLIRREWLPE